MFSKETLVAILIWITPIITQIETDIDLYDYRVYPSCINNSNNSTWKENVELFEFPSPISDLVLKLNGGGELNDERLKNDQETKKLAKEFITKAEKKHKKDEEEKKKLFISAMSKCPGSNYTEISPNKRVKKIVEEVTEETKKIAEDAKKLAEDTKKIVMGFGDSVITNETVRSIFSNEAFWVGICKMYRTLYPNNINPTQNEPKIESKGSSISADAFLPSIKIGSRSSADSDPCSEKNVAQLSEKTLSQMREKNNSMRQRNERTLDMLRLKLNENSNEGIVPNRLQPDGLSYNHRKLPFKLKKAERLTRLRRSQPLITSKVLGESFQYSHNQLNKKIYHLTNDYNVSVHNISETEANMVFYGNIEKVLANETTFRYDGVIFNGQESTITFGHPDTRLIIAFENSLMYDKNSFISSYILSDKNFIKFAATGNVGLTQSEREEIAKKAQSVNQNIAENKAKWQEKNKKAQVEENKKAQVEENKSPQVEENKSPQVEEKKSPRVEEKKSPRVEKKRKQNSKFRNSLQTDPKMSNMELASYFTIEDVLKKVPNLESVESVVTQEQRDLIDRGRVEMKDKTSFDNNTEMFTDEL